MYNWHGFGNKPINPIAKWGNPRETWESWESMVNAWVSAQGWSSANTFMSRTTYDYVEGGCDEYIFQTILFQINVLNLILILKWILLSQS